MGVDKQLSWRCRASVVACGTLGPLAWITDPSLSRSRQYLTLNVVILLLPLVLLSSVILGYRRYIGLALITSSTLILLAVRLTSQTTILWTLTVMWLITALTSMLLIQRDLAERKFDHITVTHQTNHRLSLQTTVMLTTVFIVLVPIVFAGLSTLPHTDVVSNIRGQSGGGGQEFDFKFVDTSERFTVSEKEIFTVESPLRTYLRSQTFSRWDGKTWRTDRTRYPLIESTNGWVDTEAESSLSDIGFGDQVKVKVTLGEVSLTNVPVPSRTTSLLMPENISLSEATDGTVFASQKLGEGATYYAKGSVGNAPAESLRTVEFKRLPTSTNTYLELTGLSNEAAQLAKSVTAKAVTSYDKAVALEQWLRTNFAYELDIPPLPAGRNSIDFFLFDLKRGFCQHYASAMTMMLRSIGIPARFVVGFSPGDFDPVRQVWVERESNAHAWVEAYFPGFGWQSFEPTGSTAHPGDAEKIPGASSQLAKALSQLVDAITPAKIMFGLLTVILIIAVALLVSSIRDQPAGVQPYSKWSLKSQVLFERRMRKQGYLRRNDETFSEFATRCGAPIDIADSIVADTYGPSETSTDRKQAVRGLIRTHSPTKPSG